jgi:hypothetical protein
MLLAGCSSSLVSVGSYTYPGRRGFGYYPADRDACDATGSWQEARSRVPTYPLRQLG